ncbi:MAG: hypothetical protein AAF944_04710 [Bacteroidota bacterium]
MDQKLIYHPDKNVKLIHFNEDRVNLHLASVLLFDLLYPNRCYIPDGFYLEDFVKHFDIGIKQSPPDTYIPVTRFNTSQIVYLFDELLNNRFITQGRYWRLVADHFFDCRKMCEYNPSHLATYSHRKKTQTNLKGHEKVDIDQFIFDLDSYDEFNLPPTEEREELVKQMKGLNRR